MFRCRVEKEVLQRAHQVSEQLETMVVEKYTTVCASRYLQSFNIGPKTSCKIITQACSLRLVKQEPIIEILERVFRNLNSNHGLPMVPFTASQSKSCAAPSRTLARR